MWVTVTSAPILDVDLADVPHSPPKCAQELRRNAAPIRGILEAIPRGTTDPLQFHSQILKPSFSSHNWEEPSSSPLVIPALMEGLMDGR